MKCDKSCIHYGVCKLFWLQDSEKDCHRYINRYIIDRLPSANVASRVEVAKEIFEEMAKDLVYFYDEDGELAFYAQELFEIKQKYMEEQK